MFASSVSIAHNVIMKRDDADNERYLSAESDIFFLGLVCRKQAKQDSIQRGVFSMSGKVVRLDDVRDKKKEIFCDTGDCGKAELVLRMLDGFAQTVSTELSTPALQMIAETLIALDGSIFAIASHKVEQKVVPKSVQEFHSLVWLMVYMKFLRVLAYRQPEEVAEIFPPEKKEFYAELGISVMMRFGEVPFAGNIFRVQDFILEYPNDLLKKVSWKSFLCIHRMNAIPIAVLKGRMVPDDIESFLNVYASFAEERIDAISRTRETGERMSVRLVNGAELEQGYRENVVPFQKKKR